MQIHNLTGSKSQKVNEGQHAPMMLGSWVWRLRPTMTELTWLHLLTPITCSAGEKKTAKLSEERTISRPDLLGSLYGKSGKVKSLPQSNYLSLTLEQFYFSFVYKVNVFKGFPEGQVWTLLFVFLVIVSADYSSVDDKSLTSRSSTAFTETMLGLKLRTLWKVRPSNNL